MALTTLPSRSGEFMRLPLVCAGAVAVLVLGLSSIGNPFAGAATILRLAEAMVWAGLPAAAYLLAGVGLGRLLAPLYRGSRDAFAMQVGLGVGVILTVSHLLGVVGLMGGGVGRMVAGGVVALGLGLMVAQVVGVMRARRDDVASAHGVGEGGRGVAAYIWLMVGSPALALMLVAASSPPGWLWESEGRGYDALSYHLQLPQEWLAMGRLAPLEHNVYSFLPSYVEAAFYHMGVVMGSAGEQGGLLSGSGHGVLMAQWLHAGIAVIGAVLVGRLVMVLVGCGLHGPATGGTGGTREGGGLVAGVMAGALVLSVPWVIVTGSLAYNDLGVVALLAGALIAAVDRGLPAIRRGIVVGLLIGIACGVKPTAILFAGLPAGVALLAWSRPREWGVLVMAGSVAGLAMLAPWLVRNAVYAGNPVFPFATSIFGLGHWESEQATRYAAAHSVDGGLLERLGLLVMADPDDPAGARHRGLLHPQWSVFFPVVLVMCAAALVSVRTRAVGAVLCVMLVLQVMAWLFATHLQSRFLLPLLVPGAAVFGVVVGDWLPRARLIGRAAAGVVLVVAATSVILFAREPHIEGAGPNAMLVAGPTARSGELFRGELDRALLHERRTFFEGAGPEAFVNLALPAGSRVALVGDATPLYYTMPVVYATTWDRSLLAAAMMEFPDEPGAWLVRLRQAGVAHVLVNYSELDRLERSGFLDPMLAIERVEAFMEGYARPLRVWAEGRVVLYELKEVQVGKLNEGATFVGEVHP